MRALLRSTRAELLRIRSWPAVWLIAIVWLVLSVVFGYVFPFLSYTSGIDTFTTRGQSQAALLAQITPGGIPEVLVRGMPMFGGALVLTLGALIAGAGFSWDTWKTAMLQGPRRVAVVGGTLISTAIMIVVMVIATLLVDVGASVMIAASQAKEIVWPDLGTLLQDAGAGLLIFAMWGFVGVFIGILARGPALAVGLGLVWALVVENLLRSFSSLLGPLEHVTDWMPGSAAGSLVGALAPNVAGGENAPGIVTVLDGDTAVLVVVAYAVICAGASLLVMARRDVG